MAERGIIFSAPMVRSLLAGTKTQTRRLLKHGDHYPNSCVEHDGVAILRNTFTGLRQDVRVPYAPGDRLYVREAWTFINVQTFRAGETEICIGYDADGADLPFRPSLTIADPHGMWNDKAIGWFDRRKRAAHFMPRWASRLTLTVTDVRVQRLCEISKEDAIAEGITLQHKSSSPVIAYETLWNTLHTKPGERWDDNPWVCAISFSCEQRNIDDDGAR